MKNVEDFLSPASSSQKTKNVANLFGDYIAADNKLKERYEANEASYAFPVMPDKKDWEAIEEFNEYVSHCGDTRDFD